MGLPSVLDTGSVSGYFKNKENSLFLGSVSPGHHTSWRCLLLLLLLLFHLFLLFLLLLLIFNVFDFREREKETSVRCWLLLV